MIERINMSAEQLEVINESMNGYDVYKDQVFLGHQTE